MNRFITLVAFIVNFLSIPGPDRQSLCHTISLDVLSDPTLVTHPAMCGYKAESAVTRVKSVLNFDSLPSGQPHGFPACRPASDTIFV